MISPFSKAGRAPAARRSAAVLLLASSLATGSACLAAGPGVRVVVRADRQGVHNLPLTVTLPVRTAAQANALSGYLVLRPERDMRVHDLRAQAVVEQGEARLTFLLDDLAPGQTRSFRLERIVFFRRPDGQVETLRKGDDVELRLDKDLITRYTARDAPNKPCFYPILTPNGKHITRRWPIEPDAEPGESHDHPHHRGLWFTHGSVNGVDYWSEGERTGKTVTAGIDAISSGWVCGGFRANTDWIDPAGTKVATDVRTVSVYPLPNGDRLMDFNITITPTGAPLVFGDTKEGMFGLRTADSLAINADRSSMIKGEGHIETAFGQKDDAAWGKPNAWVDYWGPIGGETYGVAIFDAPTNFRHPETWHARNYGLFAVNPFGLHDFGAGPKGAGDLTVPVSGSLTLRYRLLFHKGDARAADVANQYAGFAHPPVARASWRR